VRALPQSERPRFTLIELLVVIAIIAILASLLLPALSQARNKARITKCMNNQKQVALSLYSYAGDYDDFMPCADVQGTATDVVWQDALTQFQGLEKAVLHCPDGRKKWGRTTPTSTHYWDYCVNFGAVLLHRTGANPPNFWYYRTSNADVGGLQPGGTRIGGWLNPSNLILLADGADQNHVGMVSGNNPFGSMAWGTDQGGNEVRFGYTHDGKCVFAIADGSARVMRLLDTYHGPTEQMWFNSANTISTLPQATWNTLVSGMSPNFLY